jgi:hypothetical protein
LQRETHVGELRKDVGNTDLKKGGKKQKRHAIEYTSLHTYTNLFIIFTISQNTLGFSI